MPPPHSTQEWIANRIARADTILWREKCGLCHKAADGGIAFNAGRRWRCQSLRQ